MSKPKVDKPQKINRVVSDSSAHPSKPQSKSSEAPSSKANDKDKKDQGDNTRRRAVSSSTPIKKDEKPQKDSPSKSNDFLTVDKPVRRSLTPTSDRSRKEKVSSEERKAKTQSLELPGNKKKEPKDLPYTDLQREVSIPWDDSFRMGYGVDALTGESMSRCALSPFRFDSNKKRKISKANTSTNIVHWNDLKEILDGYEFEAGIGTGTVNVGSPLPSDLRARLSSVLAKMSSAKTLLVQYKAVGEFEMEFLPMDIKLNKEAIGLDSQTFRSQYGDYYIAGLKAGYSCRAVIVCKMNEQMSEDTFEAEARAHVEGFFTLGAKHEDWDLRSKKCSMMHAIIDTRGCASEVSLQPDSGDPKSIAAALRSLSKTVARAPGTPFVALLYHYSTLPRCTLSRRIEGVQASLFSQAHEMRQFYAHLQAFLIHPALRNFDGDRTKINNALKAFELARRNLLLPSAATRTQYEAIYKELNELQRRSLWLNARYEFIRGVKNMDTSIREINPPAGKGDKVWRCGRTGGEYKSTVAGFRLMSFGSRMQAYEARWNTPLTGASKKELWMAKLGGVGHLQHVELLTVPGKLPKGQPSGVWAVRIPQDKNEKETYVSVDWRQSLHCGMVLDL